MAENAVEKLKNGFLNGIQQLPSPTLNLEFNDVPPTAEAPTEAKPDAAVYAAHKAFKDPVEASTTTPPEAPCEEPVVPTIPVSLPAANLSTAPLNVGVSATAAPEDASKPCDIKAESVSVSATGAQPSVEPMLTSVAVKAEPDTKSAAMETLPKQEAGPQAAAAAPASTPAAASTLHAPTSTPAAVPADSDSDDDVPLAQRRLSGVGTPTANGSKLEGKPTAKQRSQPATSSVAKRKAPAAIAAQPAAKKAKPVAEKVQPASKQRKPAAAVQKRKRQVYDSDEESDSESEANSDEDDSGGELVPRNRSRTPAAAQRKADGRRTDRRQADSQKKKAETRKETVAATATTTTKEKKWDSLSHCGVLFPPEYQPHGVPLIYDGKEVYLEPEQEEVASFYAVMLNTDYAKKDTFNKNFWEGFSAVLGRKHTVKCLAKCDFRRIQAHHVANKEKEKQRSTEEKKRVAADRKEREKKFTVALVDGVEQGVGNFRVEPPGLFRGRGDHPKMGRLKRRIFPKDIIVNIGKEVSVPKPSPPYEDHSWKEVRHDNTVTWLAYWHDPVSQNQFKYVWLAANSTWKADADRQKYEKARELKNHIHRIRQKYTSMWSSPSVTDQQLGIAIYFIDFLALRAGHEKDADEEADTVGCCNLKRENVKCLEEDLEAQPPVVANTIELDFLGKDSVKYLKQVVVHHKVYSLIGKWVPRNSDGEVKNPGLSLFDQIDASTVNTSLGELMPKLSAKVFRTYNASITLDRLLHDEAAKASDPSLSVDAKKAAYEVANKEVAVLCNHQKSVAATHGASMEKQGEKLKGLQLQLKHLEEDLRRAKKGLPKLFREDPKNPDKKQPSKERAEDAPSVRKRIEAKKVAIEKMELLMHTRQELSTVALGTSKINYLDPRISVVWCKQNEVPMEKIFNKSLLTKFFWAMDAAPDFRF